MNGVLVIDKPPGPTSHDVVVRVRKALGERRIGHTGTLDPLASGVLPLVIGRATRLAQFLSAEDKTYEADVRLGLVTDTYDVTGQVIAAPPVPAEAVDRFHIEAALNRFRGEYDQVPPPYSAKKIAGVRAYDLARSSRTVVLEPVTVHVHELTLLSIADHVIRIRITVSAGFYVRSLAHDLGAELATGGALASLRRTRSGQFHGGAAVPLDCIEREPSLALSHVIGLDALLPHLPAVHLTEEGCRRALNGARLRPADLANDGRAAATCQGDDPVRLVDPAGHLRALARPAADGALHPLVVLG